MARLIDADELIAYFEEQYNVAMDDPDLVSGYVMSALRCCLGYFKTIPTVDAIPVVHGRWNIDDYDSGDPGYYSAFIEVHCSKCGYELGAESGQYGWYYGDTFPLNYCPTCGAKMDGDGNGT